MSEKHRSSTETLAERGLIELRVCVPIELCERLDRIVREKLRIKDAYRRAGRKTSSERISRSSEAQTALERFIREYERNRENYV